MLTRLFHDWERRLADVTKDRVVRPFDWGLDWIPSSPYALDGLGAGEGQGHDHRSRSARESVAAWVETVMRDTDAFYYAPPTDDYRFEPADPAAPGSGEAGTLRFASAMTTPHVENNTVVGRWFPVAGEAPAGRRPGPGEAARGRAVIVLPQWNSDPGGHIGLARLLAQCGVSALRLSLPYHDSRMPPELQRADYIVSSNVVRTVQVCRQAVLDTRRAIAWLAGQGFERVGILGSSLGSCLAMLTASHEPLIRAQALNHVSPWFADVVWRGLSTRHVREGLDGHIELDSLRAFWRPISPFAHLDRADRAPALLVYAKYDLTFPVDLSRMLIDEYGRLGLQHEVAVLPCGHYSTGKAPFKFLDAWVLIRYLRRML